MPAKKHIVDLTPAERETLLKLIRKGNPGARKTNRARILLKADEGLTDKEVAAALHTGRATVFVAQMEAILDLYELPYDPEHPMVCFDETSKQLIAEKRIPLPTKPGQVERYDYEYERNGTRNLFMFFEPLANYRHVEVTERRTKQDFAHCMRWLVDECYPAATTVRVVLDNLNTHTSGALYEAFEPAEANRVLKHLEFYYTPKHASWLNMAEIEFSVFQRQCLKARIPDAETLKREVRALEEERNTKQATVNWRFTSVDARIKLKRLYPSFSS